MLHRIPSNISRLIKSQQYVHDTYIIAKELLENSLDADSTMISLILTETSITVEDNGSGIENLDLVCKSGYTSKESTAYRAIGAGSPSNEHKSSCIQSDSSNLADTFTHGFRGQALASISEMCNIEITSRIISDQLANYKNYITGVVQKKPRERGTTVQITNLFKNCPIREKANKQSMKKTLQRLTSLIKGYSYVHNAYFQMVFNGCTVYSEAGGLSTKDVAIARHGSTYLEINDEKFDFLLFPFDKTQTQVIFVEKRQCRYSRITQMISGLFKQHFSYQPTFVLSIRDECDFSLSVDKMEVILKSSKYLENKLKSELDRYFALQQHIPDKYSDVIDSKLLNNTAKCCNISCHRGEYTNFHKTDLKGEVNMFSSYKSDGNTQVAEDLDANEFINVKRIGIPPVIKNIIASPVSKCDIIIESKPIYDNNIVPDVIPNPYKDMEEASQNINQNIYQEPLKMSVYNLIREESLNHTGFVFEKTDFRNMEVIGQFNQGFILCAFKKDNSTFIIAVDQHAADEICNFERLKSSFKIKKQNLITPIKLDLTPIKRILVDEYKDILEENGFVTSGDMLLTLPVYQGCFFTVDDFYSMIDSVSGGHHLSDKARNVIASKACRSSIMIGTCLSIREMKALLDRLSGLELPWNCPHGRPTFKVLTEIKE